MLLPRRSYGRAWRRILHDQTADYIVDIVSQLSHVNATIVPFLVGPGHRASAEALVAAGAPRRNRRGRRTTRPRRAPRPSRCRRSPESRPSPQLQWRHHARVAGRVKTLRVQPWSGVPTLECVLVDGSGEAITLVFLGRRSIPGIRSGTLMAAEAMVGKHHGQAGHDQPTLRARSRSRAGRAHVTGRAVGAPGAADGSRAVGTRDRWRTIAVLWLVADRRTRSPWPSCWFPDGAT